MSIKTAIVLTAALVLGAQAASAAENKHHVAGAHAYAAAPTYSVPGARDQNPYREPTYMAVQDQFYRQSLGQ
jgi:hypothetical protein